MTSSGTLTPAGSESSISGLLTCMTCRVGFRDSDLQRDHYKSDWHRYNLKRKIVSLPPVTAENFAERVALQEAQAKEADKDTSQYCSVCKKSFGNDKAFQSHILSKKHSLMVKEMSVKEARPESLAQEVKGKLNIAEEVGGAGGLSSSPGKGMGSPFQGRKGQVVVGGTGSGSPSVSTNFSGKGQKLGTGTSMEVDSDDDDSWEEIEGTPIPSTACLFCSVESRDLEANLEHMSLVHSFFIPDFEYCTDVEGLLEYLGSKVGEGMMCLWCSEKGKGFYDVLAVQQHMRDKGHCKMLHDTDAAFEYSDFYDYTNSYPEEMIGNPNELYEPDPLRFNENMQLVLPSGRALGHRALKRYYRQYVRPGSRSMAEIKMARRNKILNQYKAIGYGGTEVAVAQQKLRDQRYFKLIKDKYNVKLGVKGNKNLQNYFRNQVMF